MTCRFERAFQRELPRWDVIELIRALRAGAPVQDQENVKVWLKQQAAVVLSSISEKQPSMGDVETFVCIAESEGLEFLQRCVGDVRIVPLD